MPTPSMSPSPQLTRTARRLGITCALCHSTVDNSVMPGIGLGAIIALSPVLPADKKAVYKTWGPGKYHPRFNVDGKNTPLAIPPAYGLGRVKNETYLVEFLKSL